MNNADDIVIESMLEQSEIKDMEPEQSKYVSFMPHNKSRVKVRKPLEMVVGIPCTTEAITKKLYFAEHTLPAGKGDKGETFREENSDAEKAVDAVFLKMQKRLYELRRAGKDQSSHLDTTQNIQLMYLESVLNMLDGYNPSENN